jgi:hypothetical protein
LVTKKDKDETVQEPVLGIPPAPDAAERFEPTPVNAPEKIEKEGPK